MHITFRTPLVVQRLCAITENYIKTTHSMIAQQTETHDWLLKVANVAAKQITITW